jgi:hypothetical protein
MRNRGRLRPVRQGTGTGWCKSRNFPTTTTTAAISMPPLASNGLPPHPARPPTPQPYRRQPHPTATQPQPNPMTPPTFHRPTPPLRQPAVTVMPPVGCSLPPPPPEAANQDLTQPPLPTCKRTARDLPPAPIRLPPSCHWPMAAAREGWAVAQRLITLASQSLTRMQNSRAQHVRTNQDIIPG